MMHEMETQRTHRSISRRIETSKLPKPLIEKKRRARINRSLAELRVLINDVLKKEMQRTRTTRKSGKVEKADVLELTVRYIRDLKNQIQNTGKDLFDNGYCACASEVALLLQQTLEALPNDSPLSPVLQKLKQALDNSRKQRNGPNNSSGSTSDSSYSVLENKTTLSASLASSSSSTTSPSDPLTLQQIADEACTRLLTQHLNRMYYLDNMTSTTSSSKDCPKTSVSMLQKNVPVDYSLPQSLIISPASPDPFLASLNIQPLPKPTLPTSNPRLAAKNERFKLHQSHHHQHDSSYCKQSHTALQDSRPPQSTLVHLKTLLETSNDKLWRPW